VKTLSHSPGNEVSHLRSIDALRAVAAMLVVFYHMVLLPNMQIPAYLDVITHHFGVGVPLFYTLSGFVLAYGYLDKLSDRSQVLKFYQRRFFRIAPLFYSMLIVWMVASRIKWGTFPGSYHDLVLNASLLFGLVPGKHESIVWAGWSIGVEVLFYLLFPVVAVLVRSLRSGVLALALAMLVSSSFYTVASSLDIGSYAYMNIITHLPNFLCGVLAFLIWRHLGFRRSAWVGSVLLAFSVVGMLAVIYVPSTYRVLMLASGVRLDLYIWGLLFIGLILSLCMFPNRIVVNRFSMGMGRDSFSLYLWHPLIIVMLVDVYARIGLQLGTGISNFLACALVTVGTIRVVSYYSFRLIETPGMNFGKRLTNAQ
jgi:peptidoglycan/LPS O-acetylase OafA/YrhL